MKVADGYSKSSTVKSIYHYKVSFFFYHFTFLEILSLARLFLIRGKSLSRWVRNRDSWRLPRQIAIFGICRDISRQSTFSAIGRDFL